MCNCNARRKVTGLGGPVSTHLMPSRSGWLESALVQPLPCLAPLGTTSQSVWGWRSSVAKCPPSMTRKRRAEPAPDETLPLEVVVEEGDGPRHRQREALGDVVVGAGVGVELDCLAGGVKIVRQRL